MPRPRRSLVIAAFHKPTSRLAVEAVDGAVAEGDVPFVARPEAGAPPVARRAPGAGQIQPLAANPIGDDESRPAGSHGDARGAGRTEDAEGQMSALFPGPRPLAPGPRWRRPHKRRG